MSNYPYTVRYTRLRGEECAANQVEIETSFASYGTVAFSLTNGALNTCGNPTLISFVRCHHFPYGDPVSHGFLYRDSRFIP